MKERPILFSAAMVLAILANRKTQTRRIVPDPLASAMSNPPPTFGWVEALKQCRYGVPGDRLWVKETFRHFGNKFEGAKSAALVTYQADGASREIDFANPPTEQWWNTGKTPWKPSIFLRRKWSRITLEITEVRVERLQEISDADIEAEGTPLLDERHQGDNEAVSRWWHYQKLWGSINGKGSWEKNPHVWCISFKRI